MRVKDLKNFAKRIISIGFECTSLKPQAMKPLNNLQFWVNIFLTFSAFREVTANGDADHPSAYLERLERASLRFGLSVLDNFQTNLT